MTNIIKKIMIMTMIIIRKNLVIIRKNGNMMIILINRASKINIQINMILKNNMIINTHQKITKRKKICRKGK